MENIQYYTQNIEKQKTWSLFQKISVALQSIEQSRSLAQYYREEADRVRGTIRDLNCSAKFVQGEWVPSPPNSEQLVESAKSADEHAEKVEKEIRILLEEIQKRGPII
jgi:hypothetical protein